MGVTLKKLFILLLLLMILSQTALSLRINEVMYNPKQCSDSYCEWIELYNNNSIFNISGYEIKDNSGTDQIKCCQFLTECNYIIPDNAYILITDQDSMLYTSLNTTDNAIRLCVDDNSIGNGLGDDDEVSIIFGNTVLDYIDYNDSLGGDNDGNSLQLINETWYAAAPTPGYANIIEQEEEPEENETETGTDIKLAVQLDDLSYILQEYTQLFNIRILNKNDCGIEDNVTVFYNITENNNLIKQDYFSRGIGCSGYANTGSITFNYSGNYSICGLVTDSAINDTNKDNDFICKNILVIDTRTIPCNISINLTTDRMFYLDNETVEFYNNLNDESFPYAIEYWVEDLFGNIFKKKINTTNTNQKSYSPKISEQDLVLLIKNYVYALCNDSNISDNSAEKMIIIKNTDPQFLSSQENSSLEIIKIYDLTGNKAKFGQTIRANVNIYKGNTAKNSISLWIEDNKGNRVSKESTTNTYKKYMEYLLTLPVQIKPNCGYDYDDGIYTLITEGLGERNSKNIEIEGITKDLCEKTTIEKTKKTTGSFTYAIIDAPQEVFSGEEFTVQLSIKNDDSEEHEATVWSYVYRGSKCYCGNREENKKEISIAPEREEIITLNNKVIDAEPGNYKLKVNIIKDSQKTIRELTNEIQVIPSALESSANPSLQNKPEAGINLESTKYPILAYESTTIKAQELIPILVIILLAILSAVLIWKR